MCNGPKHTEKPTHLSALYFCLIFIARNSLCIATKFCENLNIYISNRFPLLSWGWRPECVRNSAICSRSSKQLAHAPSFSGICHISKTMNPSESKVSIGNLYHTSVYDIPVYGVVLPWKINAKVRWLQCKTEDSCSKCTLWLSLCKGPSSVTFLRFWSSAISPFHKPI